MTLLCGTAFYLNNRPGDNHLRFVISDPTHPEVLIVNVTTPRGRCDRSCILTPQDCSQLSHDSRIAYEFAELVDTLRLEHFLSTGGARFVMNLPNATLQKIWDGALITPHLSLRNAEFLRSQGLLP